MLCFFPSAESGSNLAWNNSLRHTCRTWSINKAKGEVQIIPWNAIKWNGPYVYGPGLYLKESPLEGNSCVNSKLASGYVSSTVHKQQRETSYGLQSLLSHVQNVIHLLPTQSSQSLRHSFFIIYWHTSTHLEVAVVLWLQHHVFILIDHKLLNTRLLEQCQSHLLCLMCWLLRKKRHSWDL